MASDRRYQVFVSSTFVDLKDERSEVVMALLRSKAFPAGMELFPASNDSAWKLIQRVIDSSDYYLLVIGGRYGSVDEETNLSYTEMEYDYAVSQKKPVMAFLHGSPDDLAMRDSEKKEVMQEKLAAFRAKVEKDHHVNYWTSPKELAGLVALTFSDFPDLYPADGWIRGDVETSAEALDELIELRKQVKTLQVREASARHEPPPGTENLSQGDDRARLTPQFEWNGDILIAPGPDDEDDEPTRRTYIDVPGSVVAGKEIGWDEYFSTIGPLMFDEATESVIKKRLSEWLTQRLRTEAMARAAERLHDVDATIERTRTFKVFLSDDDFGTLIVQLRALELIRRSERKKGLKDNQTYWSMTPWGEEHLTSLLARRRTDSLAVSDDIDVTGHEDAADSDAGEADPDAES